MQLWNFVLHLVHLLSFVIFSILSGAFYALIAHFIVACIRRNVQVMWLLMFQVLGLTPSPWHDLQVIILSVVSDTLGSPGANYAKNLIRVAILVQYLPRLYRFLPLLVGQSTIGFIFESAWANFVLNLLTYVLCGHVVGSCWYLFGLQVGGFCHVPTCLLFEFHHLIVDTWRWYKFFVSQHKQWIPFWSLFQSCLDHYSFKSDNKKSHASSYIQHQ